MTDAEADTVILWPPDVKSQLTGKDPDVGKDWRQEEKGATEWDGWIASPTQWAWVWANSGKWWTGKPGMLQFMGSQRVGHDLATEQSEKPHFLKMRQNKAAGPPSSREPALVWGGHWASGRIHSGQRGCQQSHWGWGPLWTTEGSWNQANTCLETYLRKQILKISLPVLWFRLLLPMQGVQVQSLVDELRSHIPHGPKIPKVKNRSNIVPRSIKTLKLSTSKNS